VSCAPSCGGGYLSFGSINASYHGRRALTPEWALLGGIGIGTNDDPGVDVNLSISLAGSVRYDPDNRGSSRPFFEAGLAVAPGQDTTYRRTYANGAGEAEATGKTRTTFLQTYARAGWVARLDRRTEVAATVSLGRTWLKTDAYEEVTGSSNPFEARVDSGTDVTTLASAGVQATRLLHPRIEASVNLQAHYSLEARSGLKAAVRGFGELAPSQRDVVWLQPGARLGLRLTRRWVAEFFANASIGRDGLGASVHGGFGITGRF
jgi:hypothetical protein